MKKPSIQKLNLASLVPAPWNYKGSGTPEQMAKLAESIKRDNSAGVLAVRPLPGGKYEVVDGNHRLEAVKMVGWKEVPCEVFDGLTKAEAVLLSRRRNHEWVERDEVAFVDLMKEVVFPEFKPGDIAEFMPMSLETLEGFAKIGDLEWEEPEKKPANTTPTGIHYALPKKVGEAFELQVERVKALIEGGDTEAFIAINKVLEAVPDKAFKGKD